MDRRHLISLSALTAATLAVGCAPSPTPSTEPSASETEPFRYTPPGFEDLTIELDRPAVRIVTDIYSAAALQPFGIEPVGVFGYGRDGGGKGNLDLDSLNVIGFDAEFSLEKLAAAEPDLIIGFGNGDGTGWTWWDEKVTTQATAVAPYVPVAFSYLAPEMIANYRALALLIGGGDNAEAQQQEADFTAAMERIRAVAAETAEWLTILPAQFSADAIWTSRSLGQIRLLAEAGLTFVGPEQPEDSAWAEVSWERISEYSADVLLNHETSQQYEDNPVYQNLPAVRGGQVGVWDDKRAYTWSGYAEWLNQVADVLEAAKDLVQE